WTLLAGTGPVNGVWYIDAAAVGENEPPVPEAIGTWHSPDPWVASVIGEYRILGGTNEPGAFDQIRLFNDANGAVLTFNSDAVLPEPGSLTLLGIGIAGVACIGWRRPSAADQK